MTNRSHSASVAHETTERQDVRATGTVFRILCHAEKGGQYVPQYSQGEISSTGEDVRVVRWPVEVRELEQLRRRGILRLLVIENGATPPVPTDSREDWVRAPVSRADFAARVAALRAKAGTQRIPVLDQDGLLHYDSQVVPMSPTEMELLQPLVERFGCLVARHELIALLSAHRGRASQNALDLHIMRIRRKVLSVGLRIRTASGRGYLLESSG
ncbi:helix-turn-helix domain-containing protein [Streptomyces acidicola]|uniref:helix-turn-helix domain-containing protein n=1 Tax=Streptomyces acidicola TaxID=2596892 RepID=UPI0037A536BE